MRLIYTLLSQGSCRVRAYHSINRELNFRNLLFSADWFAPYAALRKPPAKTFAKPRLALPREPRRAHAHRRGEPDGLLRSNK